MIQLAAMVHPGRGCRRRTRGEHSDFDLLNPVSLHGDIKTADDDPARQTVCGAASARLSSDLRYDVIRKPGLIRQKTLPSCRIVGNLSCDRDEGGGDFRRFRYRRRRATAAGRRPVEELSDSESLDYKYPAVAIASTKSFIQRKLIAGAELHSQVFSIHAIRTQKNLHQCA